MQAGFYLTGDRVLGKNNGAAGHIVYLVSEIHRALSDSVFSMRVSGCAGLG